MRVTAVLQYSSVTRRLARGGAQTVRYVPQFCRADGRWRASAPSIEKIDLMISKLLSRRRGSSRQSDSSVPLGERIYAIGDIHGRLDLLDDLLVQIVSDDASREKSKTTLVFLGDLVDRGPDSAGVIARLRELAAIRPTGSTRFLLGNHEEVFLRAISGDLSALKFFIRIGGRETILSFGMSEADYLSCDFESLLRMFQASVAQDVIEFIKSFEESIVVGDYMFVHAGVRPEVPLSEQESHDLRWIRDEFLSFKGSLGKVIVHGHSVSEDVDQQVNRIGIDTGAFVSGRLSAVGLEGSERWFLQTAASQHHYR